MTAVSTSPNVFADFTQPAALEPVPLPDVIPATTTGLLGSEEPVHDVWQSAQVIAELLGNGISCFTYWWSDAEDCGQWVRITAAGPVEAPASGFHVEAAGATWDVPGGYKIRAIPESLARLEWLEARERGEVR